MRVSCPVSHACDARALEYVIRWQLVSMAEVATQQSAAVRRLAALMQRDDDEAEQARQADLEQERQRAAAAQKAAAEHGVDPKTKRQIKYCNSYVRTLVHRLRGGVSPWPFNLSASVPPKEPEPRGGKTGYLRDTAPRSHRASDLGLRVYNALQGLLGIQCLQVSPGLYGCCCRFVVVVFYFVRCCYKCVR